MLHTITSRVFTYYDGYRDAYHIVEKGRRVWMETAAPPLWVNNTFGIGLDTETIIRV